MKRSDNMGSILTDVKKMLGIDESYEHFDKDIIMHTNTAFMSLSQLGIGPENGFSIVDKGDVWSDFIPEDHKAYESIKTYIGYKVRVIFDPPINSSVLTCMKDTLKEIEWRIKVLTETE